MINNNPLSNPIAIRRNKIISWDHQFIILSGSQYLIKLILFRIFNINKLQKFNHLEIKLKQELVI